MHSLPSLPRLQAPTVAQRVRAPQALQLRAPSTPARAGARRRASALRAPARCALAFDTRQSSLPPSEEEEELQAGPPPKRVTPFVRPELATYTPPSVGDSGTLRPSAEWFPAWMRFRQRDDNVVFWNDKFQRCSLDIPQAELRWTVWSTLWWLMMEYRFIRVPASLRYVIFLASRWVMTKVYEAHKSLVLLQCRLDSAAATHGAAAVAAREAAAAAADAGEEEEGAAGAEQSASSSATSAEEGASAAAAVPPSPFSKTMALRRLHWRNSLLGEALYLVNLYKTGRVHLLPPEKRPHQRPTLGFLF